MKHQIKPITESRVKQRERGTQLEFIFERLHNNVATNDRQIKPNQNYFNSQTTMHIFLGDFCKSRIRWFLPNKFHWENSFIKHSTNFGLVLNPSHKVGRDCVCVCVCDNFMQSLCCCIRAKLLLGLACTLSVT